MRISKVLLIIVLFVLAAYVRLLPAFSGNVHFSFDQGLDMIMTKQLVVDHKINLISRYSGLQGVLMGPVWTWTLAIPFAASGGNPAANIVFLSALCLGSALLMFFLLRWEFGWPTAFLTLIIALFSPQFVSNSQVVLSPNPLTFLFFFYLWGINKKNWLLTWVLVGIFFQLELAFAIITLFPLLIYFFLSKQFKSKRFWLGVGVFGLTLLPQAVFDLRHNFLITKSLLTFLSGNDSSLYKEGVPLVRRFGERLATFREDFAAMALYFQVGVLSLITLIAAGGGWWKVKVKHLSREIVWGKMLLIVLGCFFIGFTLYPGSLWGWYRAGLPVVYILLLTIPIGRTSKILVAGFVLAFLAQGLLLVNTPQTSGSNLSVQERVLDYVYTSSSGQNFFSFVYTPPVYDYIWQYDYWWYGRQKYGRLPDNWQMSVPLLGVGTQSPGPTGQEKLMYLIIEPDFERPWAPAGWLETYIKSGRPISRQTFPGGIVVEKRVAAL
ncbi:MAG: hypothetical protein M1484_00415 [Patescibacteria group bacterium]|nr:hypothetical protein [Patescibacteria group bacterium]MCL5431543.1 hypothetical protein [Patescibacteria group bacterium]